MTGNWVFVPPFVVLAVLLVLFVWTVWGELQVRWAGRHRGVYDPEIGKAIDPAGCLVWEGEIRFPAYTPDVGTAWITIAPDLGVANLPVLCGPAAPPIEFVVEGDRVFAETASPSGNGMVRFDLTPANDDYELDRRIESLIQRHERLYHPVAA